MLVVSRKTGERLLIGNEIVVTVLARRGSRICLGIEAPQSVAVCREEVFLTTARVLSSARHETGFSPGLSPGPKSKRLRRKG